jgi:hypothetical protein
VTTKGPCVLTVAALTSILAVGCNGSTPTSNSTNASQWAPSEVKVTGNYRSEDLEKYTVIKKDEKEGDHLYLDVLVSEKTPKQSVLFLAEEFRKKHVGQYSGGVVIGIWDSERVCRNFEDLPEDEAYLHFLAEVQILGKKDQGQISWAGKGRDH